MMRGIRGRIGIIHLWSAMMDHEFWEMAPEGVSIFCTRLRGHPPTIEGIKNAAMDLADCKLHSILYGCTSGSFGPGPAWNDLLIKTMQETLGIPATTNSQAAVEALKTLRSEKIAVSTPYDEEYNQKLKSFLEAKGFTVVNMKRTQEHLSDFGKFLLSPEQVYTQAKEAFVPEADALFISCAGWRTLPIIETLENDIGAPVVSSVQAVMWHALRLAGINEKMEGRGKLLRI